MLLRLKSQNTREASLHPAFYGLLVTRLSLIYLVDDLLFLFLVYLNETRRLDKSKVLLFVVGVNQVE